MMRVVFQCLGEDSLIPIVVTHQTSGQYRAVRAKDRAGASHWFEMGGYGVDIEALREVLPN